MKAAIIGYGHAGQAYLSAFSALGMQEEIVLVDLDQSVRARVPTGVKFYTELPQGQFDIVIVATPPATHLGVLKGVHEQASRIILEKPFALNAKEIDAIFDLARAGKIFFSIHARYGEELALAKKALSSLPKKTVTCVSQLYCDPYWPDGPSNLGGPFWDSIFNALGVLNVIYDGILFNDIAVLADRDDIFDVACRGMTKHGLLRYRLSVDWSRALNLKVTEIADEARFTGILINHSQQCISALSGLNFEQRTFSQPRLAAHYEAVVNDCLALDELNENRQLARRIADQVVQIAAIRTKT